MFTDSLIELLDAVKDEKEAREAYSGLDWICRRVRHLEKVKKAEERLMSALQSVIDERVNEILAQHNIVK